MRVKRTAVTDQPYINCNVLCGLDLHGEMHTYKFWIIIYTNLTKVQSTVLNLRTGCKF